MSSAFSTLATPLLGDGHGALLLVDLVVLAGDEPRHDAGELAVRVGGRLRRAADDERRARLVDEDGVDLVHDAEGVAALDQCSRRMVMLSRR